MKLIGDILRIKNKRDDQHRDIEIHIDQIEYITHKKDGRFFQPFDFIDDLDAPVVITGDYLARAPKNDFEEEDYVFKVYDKIGEDYILSENKNLVLTLIYVEEAEQTILNSGTYSITVSNDEFNQIKRERSQEKKLNKGRAKKRT